MPRIINKDDFKKIESLCKNGKHKFRENKFGVTWCIRCGCLSNTIGTSNKLQEDEKLIIINHD